MPKAACPDIFSCQHVPHELQCITARTTSSSQMVRDVWKGTVHFCLNEASMASCSVIQRDRRVARLCIQSTNRTVQIIQHRAAHKFQDGALLIACKGNVAHFLAAIDVNAMTVTDEDGLCKFARHAQLLSCSLQEQRDIALGLYLQGVPCSGKLLIYLSLTYGVARV